MPKSRRRCANLPVFVAVPRAQRRDGWTPEAQIGFIEALAASGCVAEACQAVGKSRASAYRLRADPNATSFRLAWEVALDHAIRGIADAAYSRALTGVVTPIYYRGEQVGERVRHDERLVMFLLRYRDPLRYGRANDRSLPDAHLDSPAQALGQMLHAVEQDAVSAELAIEGRLAAFDALDFVPDADSDSGTDEPIGQGDSDVDVSSLSSLSTPEKA